MIKTVRVCIGESKGGSRSSIKQFAGSVVMFVQEHGPGQIAAVFIDRNPIFTGYCEREDKRMIKNEQFQTDENSRWLDETEEEGIESKAIIV